MLPFFGFTFVLFCFVFVFFMLFSLKPRLLVHTFFVFRYACAPTATRSCCLAAGTCVLFRCLFFLFLFLWRCRYFPVFLYNYHFVCVQSCCCCCCLHIKAVVNIVGGLLASRRVFSWLPLGFFGSYSTDSY